MIRIKSFLIRKSIFILPLVLIIFGEAKPPSLTPRDAKTKIEEILKAHVSHQKLTAELVKRSFENYIEEIDPSKTYFLESEVDKWIHPSDELIENTLILYRQENFSAFEELHKEFLTTVTRRNELEAQVDQLTLPEKVSSMQFKDLQWLKSENELLERLLNIRSLQKEAQEKLNNEWGQQFLQKVAKRRLKREEELRPKSQEEQKQVILSLVLKSISGSLDSQTAYFTPSEANQFLIQVQQRLFGIGAELRDDLTGFRVVRLLEGGAAMLSNQVKAGDRIIAVNKEPVVGMEITEAVDLIRGPEGTQVLLTILRDTGEGDLATTEKLDIELIRGEVVLKERRLETHIEPYGDGIIGILHLHSFYQDQKSSSASDLAAAINKLKKEHIVKGLVLDLRNNSGGLLPQAVAVTGLFIKKGIVASVKDNTGEIHHLRNVDENIVWNGPMIVLTNLITASSSEIVSQTLQDYGRALIIGDPHTWGKGSFQTFTLESTQNAKVNPKGEFKVTRGKYYTVSGKSPQLIGVQSDINVLGPYAHMEMGESFTKFPLENDSINPHFEDNLSDVPMMHRAHAMLIYKRDLQPVLTSYQPYLELLKANSQQRIELSKNYQNFLKELKKTDDTLETAENFGQNDLQRDETLNIMKDLILLMEKNQNKT